MESDKIEVDKAQLETLLNENQELRETLKEGAKLFSVISLVLGLNDGVSTMSLTLKLPKIINKFQKDPELVDKFANYIEKTTKYLPNEDT